MQQQAQRRVLIRMPSSDNSKAKEQPHEKTTSKQANAPSDMRDAIRSDFAIPPVFHKPDEKRRSTELDPLEMEAIRAEAVNYTRPFEGGEGRAK